MPDGQVPTAQMTSKGGAPIGASACSRVRTASEGALQVPCRSGSGPSPHPGAAWPRAAKADTRISHLASGVEVCECEGKQLLGRAESRGRARLAVVGALARTYGLWRTRDVAAHPAHSGRGRRDGRGRRARPGCEPYIGAQHVAGSTLASDTCLTRGATTAGRALRARHDPSPDALAVARWA